MNNVIDGTLLKKKKKEKISSSSDCKGDLKIFLTEMKHVHMHVLKILNSKRLRALRINREHR